MKSSCWCINQSILKTFPFYGFMRSSEAHLANHYRHQPVGTDCLMGNWVHQVVGQVSFFNLFWFIFQYLSHYRQEHKDSLFANKRICMQTDTPSPTLSPDRMTQSIYHCYYHFWCFHCKEILSDLYWYEFQVELQFPGMWFHKYLQTPQVKALKQRIRTTSEVYLQLQDLQNLTKGWETYFKQYFVQMSRWIGKMSIAFTGRIFF